MPAQISLHIYTIGIVPLGVDVSLGELCLCVQDQCRHFHLATGHGRCVGKDRVWHITDI